MAMTLRLTDEQDAALTRIAAEQGISKQEAVVRAIDAYANGRTQRRADLLKRIVSEDAKLLDLLAQ